MWTPKGPIGDGWGQGFLFLKRGIVLLWGVSFFVLCLGRNGVRAADTEGREPRVFEAAPYPRVAMLWASLRGDSTPAAKARHDLIMLGTWDLGLEPDRKPMGEADGFTSPSIAVAQKRVAELRRLNPDAVILGDLCFYEYQDAWLPEDHPWWLRVEGKRQQFWPGTHRMDWNQAEYRRHVAKQTAALKQTGVDGVFYDNLRPEQEPWVAFLKEVRQAVGDEFLVLANAGYAVGEYDWVAPYLNGFMYESGWSHNRTAWDETIRKMQHTETLLRAPRISVIERFEEIRDRAGWPNDEKKGQKPPRDPAARRWSLCYALTVGNFYYLFSDSTSHQHDWYPEYDVKIGQPREVGQRVSDHVWQRRYDKALVVVNLPGASAPYPIELPAPARDALTGKSGTRFEVPSGDGCVLVFE